ncbi:MAG: hypothetical protein HPY71_00600 [Firmicutes bacterium]|nr:hypothetical protein [Bacillota bacterium]
MNRIVALMAGVVCLLTLMLSVASTCLAIQGSDDAAGTATHTYDAVFTSNIITAFPNLNLSAEAIQKLRSTGAGWGEITIAASLASASGKTLDEVMAMADSGLGWGEIAKILGVEPKSLGHAVSEVIGSPKKEWQKGPKKDENIDENIDEDNNNEAQEQENVKNDEDDNDNDRNDNDNKGGQKLEEKHESRKDSGKDAGAAGHGKSGKGQHD